MFSFKSITNAVYFLPSHDASGGRSRCYIYPWGEWKSCNYDCTGTHKRHRSVCCRTLDSFDECKTRCGYASYPDSYFTQTESCYCHHGRRYGGRCSCYRGYSGTCCQTSKSLFQFSSYCTWKSRILTLLNTCQLSRIFLECNRILKIFWIFLIEVTIPYFRFKYPTAPSSVFRDQIRCDRSVALNVLHILNINTIF